MMKKTVKSLLILIAVLLMPILTSADLDMTVTAEINDITSDVHLKTSSNADDGLDGYDMVAPTSPSDYSTLSSNVEESTLAIDTCNTSTIPRTVNLTYEVSPSQTGILNLTWNSVTTGYTANLSDYGTDDTYSTLVDSVDMDSQSSYNTSLDDETIRYFQVTINEAPAAETPTGGGGGGGAAEAASSVVSDFLASKDIVKLTFKQGETTTEFIRIANTGNTLINIDVTIENVGKFIAVSENSFSLQPGETKSLRFDIFAKEDELPDAYIGRIIIKGGGILKVINVILEVKERKPLFDIIARIVTGQIFQPGALIESNIDITNMGDLEHIDILLYYAVMNFEGKIFAAREESLAIGKELKTIKAVEIPKDLPEGDYVFYTKASYGKITAASSDMFKVEKPPEEKKIEFLKMPKPSKPITLSIIGGLILVAIAALFVWVRHRRKYY